MRNKTVILAIFAIMGMIMFIQNGSASSIMEGVVNKTIPVHHGDFSSSLFYFRPDAPANFTFFAVSPFNFTFKPTVLPFPDWVFFNVSVPKFFPSGNYSARIFAQSPIETIFQDVNISVLPLGGYNLSYQSPFIASTGDTYFKYINITNIGNTFISIDANIDHEIARLSQKFRLYPGMSAQMPYLISIPKDYKLGTYNIPFSVLENKTEYLNISVFDRESPKIDKIEVNETTRYSKAIQIKVFASDNKGIDKVLLTQDDKIQQLQNKTDEGYFYGSLEANKLGSIDYFLDINDTSGNKVSVGKRFSVSRLEGVQVIESIAGRIKQGYVKESDLLSSVNPIKFTIILKDFTFKPAPGVFINQSQLSRDNYTFYVSTEQRIDLTQNRAEPIESKDGKAKIFFSSNAQGHFAGNLILDFDKNIADPVIVPFAFNVGTYTVTQNRTMYLGGKPTPCSPDDTGFYENSSYNCIYKFPIDIPESSIGIFTTQKEIDAVSLPLKFNSTKIEEEKHTVQFWGTIYFYLLIVLVGGSGLIAYLKNKGVSQ